MLFGGFVAYGCDGTSMSENTLCEDSDGDGCDDCAKGTKDPSNDGPDFDKDGLCDSGDADIDNDGSLNGNDSDDKNVKVCSDTDGDTCDDCSGGSYDPNNDGSDLDKDGDCDVHDSDIDGDGVDNNEDVCVLGVNDDDADSDGVPDQCDACPGEDDNDVGKCGHVGNHVYAMSANEIPGFYGYTISTNVWQQLPSPPTTTRVQLTNDGTFLYMYGEDDWIYRYDSEQQEWFRAIQGHGGSRGPIGFFAWVDGAFYHADDGTKTLNIWRQGVWSTVVLSANVSSAGTWDAPRNELYIRTMSQLGFQVVDTTIDTIARTIRNTTSASDNSRTGSYSNGSFYSRALNGSIQRLDAQTGAIFDTGLTPISDSTASDTDHRTGAIYIGGFSSNGKGFQVYLPQMGILVRRADLPASIGKGSSVSVMRSLPAPFDYSAAAIAGPHYHRGYAFYLAGGGNTCDKVCEDLRAENLAAQVENLWGDSCNAPGADDPAEWFYNNGNPGVWGAATGSTDSLTLGYGHVGGARYGKCSTGTTLGNGSYLGDDNVSIQRTPVCACAKAPPVVFSANFHSGVTADAAIKKRWTNFRAALTKHTFFRVTIRGSNDPVGRTCTDPAVVNQLAAALAVPMSTELLGCNGHRWQVYSGNYTEIASVDTNDADPSCENPGYKVRPDISNENWGGINGATCGPPTQSMEVVFESDWRP